MIEHEKENYYCACGRRLNPVDVAVITDRKTQELQADNAILSARVQELEMETTADALLDSLLPVQALRSIDVADHRYARSQAASHYIASLTVRAERAENECLEQARLLGMGSEQEASLLARAERLQAELAEAHGYGSRLFLRLNPQCTVFDDMPGLMTQFDNYIAGQLQDIAAEKAARERAEQELANFGDRISAAIGTNDYLDPPDGGEPELAEQVRRMRTEVVRLKEIAVLSRRFMRANWCTAEYYQLQRELLDKLRAALGGWSEWQDVPVVREGEG